MIVLEALLALVVGGAALLLVLWPLLRPDALEAPAPVWDVPDLEETRKGQALIALKEIEFDLATGKLSQGDYDELKRKYTHEAVAALREAGAPAAAAAPAASGLLACPEHGPRPESDAIFCSTCGRLLSSETCACCGAALRPGARFCEGCGRATP